MTDFIEAEVFRIITQAQTMIGREQLAGATSFFPDGPFASSCYGFSWAVSSLVQLGVDAIPALVRALDGGVKAEMAAEAIHRIGRAAVPELCGALRTRYDGDTFPTSPQIWLRYNAAKVLARIGDTSAVPALIDCLNLINVHTDEFLVFLNVAEALGAIGEVGAIPALIEFLTDDELAVRRAAAAAILAMNSAKPETLPHKVLAASHLSIATRRDILEKLGRIRAKGVSLRFRLLPLAKYCKSIVDCEDIEEQVKDGARAILAEQVLLRATERDTRMDATELVRGAVKGDSLVSSCELLRASEEPYTPIKRVQRYWNRLMK